MNRTRHYYLFYFTLDLANAVRNATNSRPSTNLYQSHSGFYSPKTVLLGFIATWFLAASPMRRSVSVNATYDGVVRFPWSLAMISTLRKSSRLWHYTDFPRSRYELLHDHEIDSVGHRKWKPYPQLHIAGRLYTACTQRNKYVFTSVVPD